MNIPNMLSIFRIFLIPIFIYYYFNLSYDYFFIPALILILSGITDVLDGFIARKYNSITQLGKILDPLADKLTQFALCLCFTIRYNGLLFLLIIFLLKEILMLLGGILLVKSGFKIQSARWYGKLSTFVFYLSTFILILIYDVPMIFLFIYSLIIIIFTLFSLLMYIFEYFNIRKDKLDSSKEKINDL